MTQHHAQHIPADLQVDMISDPAQIAPMRQRIEHYCADAGASECVVANVGLCVNEAIANIIRHAYDGATDRPIRLNASCIGQLVRVEIRDWGNGVNPETIPPRTYDPLTPGGVGLICMQKLTESLHYEPQPDGMLLVMTYRRDTSKQSCDRAPQRRRAC